MRKQTWNNISLTYAFLWLAACLILTSSCKNNSSEDQLPLSMSYGYVSDRCLFNEIRNFKEVPEKLKLQARQVLLKYMEPSEIDSQLEFLRLKIHEKCEYGNRWPYTIRYIRHLNNGIISSLSFVLYFDKDQNFVEEKGLPDVEYDPRFKNYISKNTLNKILKTHNFADYDQVRLDYLLSKGFYGSYFLTFTRKNKKRKKKNLGHRSKASVNLHTGEFKSKDEWNKFTATNFSLIPRYGGGKG